MKGRASFSINEIHAIEHLLSRRRERDKTLRRLRRDYRFYVSDYAARDGRLTNEDVERLIAQGVIRVRR